MRRWQGRKAGHTRTPLTAHPCLSDKKLLQWKQDVLADWHSTHLSCVIFSSYYCKEFKGEGVSVHSRTQLLYVFCLDFGNLRVLCSLCCNYIHKKCEYEGREEGVWSHIIRAMLGNKTRKRNERCMQKGTEQLKNEEEVRSGRGGGDRKWDHTQFCHSLLVYPFT